MKTAKTLVLTSVITLSMTTSVFASWWNPFTWFHKKVVAVVQVQSTSPQVARNVEVVSLATSTTATSTEIVSTTTSPSSPITSKIFSFEKPKESEFTGSGYPENPNPLRYNGYAAYYGTTISDVSLCKNLKDKEGFCVGGYAAKTNNPNLYLTYIFKYLYHAYPGCDCDEMPRGKGGNSLFEDYFVGYGLMSTATNACNSLQKPTGKNVPQFNPDKTPVEKIALDSCHLGQALATSDVQSCSSSGYYKDYCIYGLAIFNKIVSPCSTIEDKDMKALCYGAVAPISGDYKSCQKIEEVEEASGLVFYTNVKTNEPRRTRTQYSRDSCVQKYVDLNKVLVKTACEDISDANDKNRCYLKVAINIGDEKNCSTAFGLSEGNIGSCKQTFATKNGDISACQNTANSAMCIKDIAVAKKDPSLCNSSSDKGWCLFMVGKVVKDVKVCEAIPTGNDPSRWRANCYKDLAATKKDINYCNIVKAELSQDSSYDWCVTTVAVRAKNDSLCDQLSSPASCKQDVKDQTSFYFQDR